MELGRDHRCSGIHYLFIFLGRILDGPSVQVLSTVPRPSTRELSDGISLGRVLNAGEATQVSDDPTVRSSAGLSIPSGYIADSTRLKSSYLPKTFQW